MTKLKKAITITLLLSIFSYFSCGLGEALSVLGFSLFQSILIGSLFGMWVVGILVGFVAIVCGIIDWWKKGEKK